MNTRPHFTALLTYASEKDGGRSTPASSGFRSAIKFPFGQRMFFGIQNFTDAELAFAGDSVTAEITLLDFNDLKDSLYEGLDFEFFETDLLIGSGVILKCFPFCDLRL